MKIYVSYFFEKGFNNAEAGFRVADNNHGKYFFGIETLQNYSDCAIIYLVQQIKKVLQNKDLKFIVIIADKRLRYLSQATYLKSTDWIDKKGNKIDRRVYKPLHDLILEKHVIIKKNLSIQDNDQIGDLTEHLQEERYKNEFGKSIES